MDRTEQFAETYRLGGRLQTGRTYSGAAKQFEEFLAKHGYDVTNAPPDMLGRFALELLNQGRSGGGTYTYCIGVRRYLEFLKEQGIDVAEQDPPPISKSGQVKMADTSWKETAAEMAGANGTAPSVTVEESVEEEAPPSPPTPPLQAAPKRAQGKKPTPSSQGYNWRKPGYFRNASLDALVPSSERVKLWKRLDDGKLAYIGDYTLRDLDRVQDIEQFIQTYLVPLHGAGEFEVALINAKGEVTRQVSYMIAKTPNGIPAPVQAGSSDASTAATMVDHLLRRLEAVEEKRESALSDKLREMQALMELFGAKKDEGGMNPLMLFMLQNLMSRGPDPELVALKAELRALAEKVAQPPPMPPMPMPPPEPALDIGKLAELLKPQFSIQDIVALTRPQEPPKERWSIKDILSMLPAVMPYIEKLTGKEEIEAVLGELADMRREEKERRKSSLRETLDDLRALKEVARDTFRPESQSFAQEFISFLRESFSPERLDRLGDLVEKIRGKRAAAHGGSAPRRVVRALPAAKPNGQSKKQAKSKKVKQEAPELPPKFVESVGALNEAKDDAGRIQAALEAFTHLAADEKWAKWARHVQALAKEGEKEEILKILQRFLDGLTVQHLIDEITAKKTLKAFKEHADDVLAWLSGAK